MLNSSFFDGPVVKGQGRRALTPRRKPKFRAFSLDDILGEPQSPNISASPVTSSTSAQNTNPQSLPPTTTNPNEL